MTTSAPTTPAHLMPSDWQGWLVKEVTHTLGDSGWTTKVSMERGVSQSEDAA